MEITIIDKVEERAIKEQETAEYIQGIKNLFSNYFDASKYDFSNPDPPYTLNSFGIWNVFKKVLDKEMVLSWQTYTSIRSDVNLNYYSSTKLILTIYRKNLDISKFDLKKFIEEFAKHIKCHSVEVNLE